MTNISEFQIATAALFPYLDTAPTLTPTLAQDRALHSLTLDTQHLAQLQGSPAHLAQCAHDALCIGL